MKKSLFSDIQLGIPILMFPVENSSNGAENIMKLASSSKFMISPKNFNGFIKFCEERKLKVPCEMQAYVLTFNNIFEFFYVQNLILRETQIVFFSFYTIAIIIDYSVNKNITSILSMLENTLEAYSERYQFFIINATDDCIQYESATVHIIFCDSTDTEKIQIMAHSFNISIIEALKMTSCLATHDPSRQIRTAAERQILYSLLFMSPNEMHLYNSIEAFAHGSDNTIEFNSNLYEILGFVENYKHGLTKKIPQMVKLPTDISPWPLNVGFCDLHFIAFSLATGYYMKTGNFAKAADCAIRAISNGYLAHADMVCSLITAHSGARDMEARARNLISLCERMNIKKKAALIAYKLGLAFSDDARNEFWLSSIRLLKDAGNFGLIKRDLYAPLINDLLSCALDPAINCSLIFDVLSDVGERLPLESQEKLFSRLLTLPTADYQNRVKFPFVVKKCQIPLIPVTISKKAQSQPASIFIYNGLARASKVPDVATGTVFRVIASIHNCFRVPISAIVRAVSVKNCSASNATTELKPLSDTDVALQIVPGEGEFVLEEIALSVFDSEQILKLPEPIKFRGVAGAPAFTVRTSLPLKKRLELYSGEATEFRVWVLNTSANRPIDGVRILFPYGVRFEAGSIQGPLEPLSEASIGVTVYAAMGMKSIAFRVVCAAADADVEASFSIDQPVSVKEALSVSKIFNLPIIPEIDCDPSKLAFFGVEITNAAREAFSYSAAFKGTGEVKNASGFLSCDMTEGIVGATSSAVILIAADRSKINITKPNTVRASSIKKIVEESTGRKITKTELNGMCNYLGNVAEFIGENLKFVWECGSKRGSINLQELLPDEGVVSALIETPNCISTATEGSLTPLSEIKLKVSLEKKAFECILDLGEFADSSFGVAWKGPLRKVAEVEEGSNEFEYVLCFVNPGVYEFSIIVDGITSKVTVSVG